MRQDLGRACRASCTSRPFVIALLSAIVVAGSAPALAHAQAASDVYLVPLTKGATGWTVGVPANVSRFVGYDNQPAFAADGRALFYTQIGADGQSDIWRSEFGTGIAAPVQATKESEYSAFPTPAGDALTVVRVEADSAQRLWRLPLDGSAPTLLVADVKPVGYFAFATDTTLAMFVLGSPATLQVATIGRPGTRTVASNIGRSLHRIPDSDQISFVQKGPEGWFIVRLDPARGSQDTIVATRPRREDYAWLDATTLVMGDEAALYTYTLGDPDWKLLGDFEFAGLRGISRLAVSPASNGRPAQWLAVTAVGRENTTSAAPRPAAVVNPADVRRDVFILAADSMEGRATGTPGGDRAARWLASEFARAGLKPAGDSGAYLQHVPLTRGAASAARPRPRAVADWEAWNALPADQRLTAANVVGVIEGADPALRDQAVLVTAHYDHLGIAQPQGGQPLQRDSIFNGADDDASGTVALLELARQLASGAPPARTIVFAAVTGEEVGLIGTRWYIGHPVRPLNRTVANFNIEMIGRPDSLTGGVGTAWLTGYERSTFGDLLAAAGVPIVPDPRPAQRFFERSDNYGFARVGIPAHTLSTFNLHGDYHTVSDGPESLDIDHMARVIDAALIALRTLANAPEAPSWHPGGKP